MPLAVPVIIAYLLVALIFVGVLVGYLEEELKVWIVVVVAALWPLSLLLGLGAAIGKELQKIRKLEKELEDL